MAKFVQLTQTDGRKMCVNPDHVVLFQPADEDQTLLWLAITTGAKNFPQRITVAESYDKVLRFLA